MQYSMPGTEGLFSTEPVEMQPLLRETICSPPPCRAVISKLPDEAFLAGHDLPGIKADLFHPQAKLGGMAQGPVTVRRLDQGLARHAAPQDAEPADFLTSLDDDRRESK